MRLKARNHDLLEEKQVDLDNLRDEKLKQRDLTKAFKSIMSYVLFLLLSLVISYQLLDTNAYQYSHNLKNIFGDGDKFKSFNQVKYLKK